MPNLREAVAHIHDFNVPDIFVPTNAAPVAMIDALVNADIAKAQETLPKSPEVTAPQAYNRFQALLRKHGEPNTLEMGMISMSMAADGSPVTTPFLQREEMINCPDVSVQETAGHTSRSTTLFSSRTTGERASADQDWTDKDTDTDHIHLFLYSDPKTDQWSARRSIWLSPTGLRDETKREKAEGAYVVDQETHTQQLEGDAALPDDLALLMPLADFLEETYENPPADQDGRLESFLTAHGLGFIVAAHASQSA